MDLTLLTCASLPQKFVHRDSDPELRSVKLDPVALFEFVTGYAEFTWTKARYMLEEKGNPPKAAKNLYFVFRLIELGCQLLEEGRVADFFCGKPLVGTHQCHRR